MKRGLIIDLFAGGGGASEGIKRALGIEPDYAINHDPDALLMHAVNHPGTVHLTENVWKADPHAITKGKPVWLLWLSPDCRDHSKAKGGMPVSKSVRSLADVALYWAKVAPPEVIALENVEEWRQWGPLNEDGRPCKDRRGHEFFRWVRTLESMGYEVDWFELRACDYGAPTIRKRLFLIARRDGFPILLPEPTHGNPRKSELVKVGKLKPWRTAAKIIDWHLPCPSIFMTKAEAKDQGLKIIRPLAAKTMSRIARGFKRYVLDRPEPFIVTANHAGEGFRGQGLEEPFRTVAAARDAHGLVAPFVGVNRFDAAGAPADGPLPTVTANSFIKRPGAGGPLSVVAPYLAETAHGDVAPNGSKRWGLGHKQIDAPIGTVTRTNNKALISPFLSHAQQGGRNRSAEDPLHTVCASTKDQNQIVTGYLVPRYGERDGQEPRARDVLEPAPTIVPGGNGGGLASVFLAQHNGGERAPIGRDADAPAATITTEGSQVQPVMAYLSALQNNTARGDADEPVGTVLADGNHHSVVTPFIQSYYSNGGQDQPADRPLGTVPTKGRFSPITGECCTPPLADWQIARARAVAEFLRAEGVWDGGEFVTVGPFIVWDIGMRMLTPRELARAQGFHDSYDITAGGKLTETAQRHKIGNSVSPYPAEALIRANLIEAYKRPRQQRRRLVPMPEAIRPTTNITPDLFAGAA